MIETHTHTTPTATTTTNETNIENATKQKPNHTLSVVATRPTATTSNTTIPTAANNHPSIKHILSKSTDQTTKCNSTGPDLENSQPTGSCSSKGSNNDHAACRTEEQLVQQQDKEKEEDENHQQVVSDAVKEDSHSQSSQQHPPPPSLDFIGSSRAMKNLFAIPYLSDQSVCVAVHNFDGTLLIDTEDGAAVQDAMISDTTPTTPTITENTRDHSNRREQQQEQQQQQQQQQPSPSSTLSTDQLSRPQEPFVNHEQEQQHDPSNFPRGSRSLALTLSPTLLSSSSDVSTRSEALLMLDRLVQMAHQQDQKQHTVEGGDVRAGPSDAAGVAITSNILVDPLPFTTTQQLATGSTYSSLPTTTTTNSPSQQETLPTINQTPASHLIPQPPREYLQWNFQDMNVLVGSDAFIWRPASNTNNNESTTASPSTTNASAVTIRLEEASRMRRLLKNHQESVQRGKFIPDHQLTKLQQLGKPSYAQALFQQQPENDQDKSLDSKDSTNQGFQKTNTQRDATSSFAAPNLDQVRLQTCIVPSSGPLGGLLEGSASIQPVPSPSSSKDSMPSSSTSSSSTSKTSPVSVVLDTYLDNLMANVPQLALCLHEKGFVQSVKLLQTDDIPSMLMQSSTLDTSKPFDLAQPKTASTTEIFSPQVMEMNASALLRFLKANCTSNNTTYLLRREQGETNIELYDISSISTKRQRKWVWWLATMSYRFALRLRHLEHSALIGLEESSMRRRSFRDRQRSLFQTTLDLLEDLVDMDGSAHESLVAAVREHLADTFLSNNSSSTRGNERNGNYDIGTTGHPDANVSEPKQSKFPTTTSSAASSSQRQQPYAFIPADGLNKAQDHLLNGIKVLWPTLENCMKSIQGKKRRREEKIRKQMERRRRSRRQRSQVVVRDESSSGTDESDGDEMDDKHVQLYPGEALVMQLFGLHYKLINVSLRLVEHHLQTYWSSSAMQALRTAARRLADAGLLLQLLGLDQPENDDSQSRNLLKTRLQMQYIWLWENCGHFARSFASDELWRDRGHACGDDVISVLRDVESAFSESNIHSWMVASHENDNIHNNSDRKATDPYGWYEFTRVEDPFCATTGGMVSLHSLSAIVDVEKTSTDHDQTARESKNVLSPPSNNSNPRTAESVEAAVTILENQRQLQRDKRHVLVASCISYGRAIAAFEDMVFGRASSDERTIRTRHRQRVQPRPGETTDDPAILNLLRQRLGDACNETGKALLSALRTLLSSRPSESADPKSVPLAADAMLWSAKFWFLEGLDVFEDCTDLRNIALLRCNLCQCFKLRANSSFDTEQNSSSNGSTHAELCLQEAADHLQLAHEALGDRSIDPMTWDMVSEELAATFLVLGVRRRQSLLGGGNAPVVLQALRLTPGKERSVVEPMEKALKIYEQSGNAHQAAAVHYQLALTNSKVWTCQRDEARTREKLSLAFQHYNMAFSYFRNSMRGNEATFILLCLDIASLYAAVSGDEECLTKALSRCLETADAFSHAAIEAALYDKGMHGSSNEKQQEWFDKMQTLGSSVEDRVFKLLRSLVKLESSGTTTASTNPKGNNLLNSNSKNYKELYRVGLTAKMVQNASPSGSNSDDPRAKQIIALHDVLVALKSKFDE